jgi:hypothetical protein
VNSAKESWMLIAGAGGGKMLVQGYKHSVIRQISFGVVIYSMVTIMNNNVHLKFSERLDTKCWHPTQKKGTMWGDGCVFGYQNTMLYILNV